MKNKNILLKNKYYGIIDDSKDFIDLYSNLNLAIIGNSNKNSDRPYTFNKVNEYSLSNELNIFDIKNKYDIGKFRVYCNNFHNKIYNKILNNVTSIFDYLYIQKLDTINIPEWNTNTFNIFIKILKSLHYDGYIDSHFSFNAFLDLNNDWIGKLNYGNNEHKRFSITIFKESRDKLIKTKSDINNIELDNLLALEKLKIESYIMLDYIEYNGAISKNDLKNFYLSQFVTLYDKIELLKNIDIDKLYTFVENDNNKPKFMNENKFQKLKKKVEDEYIDKYYS